MRKKVSFMLALMLCLGVFCFPITAYAVEYTVTVRAWISGDTLRVETSDAGSGIEAVYINDSRVNYLVDSALDVAAKDYAGTDDYISVYAVDFTGNKSNVVQIKNPYYIAPVSTAPASTPAVSEIPVSSQTTVTEPNAASSSTSGTTANTATSTNTAAQSVTPSAAVPSVEPATAAATESPVSDETTMPDELQREYTESGETETPVDEIIDDNAESEENPFTPDGTGTVMDNATESDGKEFFTIITADENVFYLIIDRERSSDNVYLLIPVTEDDLMSLAKKSDSTGSSESVIPTTEPLEPSSESSPEPSLEPEAEPASGGSNTGTIIFIVVAVIAVGGVGYYFKILKPKRDAEMDNDEDYDENSDDEEKDYEMDEVDESYQELLDEAEYSDESDYDDDVE